MNKEYLDHLSDMTIEEFDAVDETHEFSDTYKMKKQRLIREYQAKEKKARRWLGMPKAAAVALICLLSTGTVFAATKLIHLNAERKSAYSVEVQMTKEDPSETVDNPPGEDGAKTVLTGIPKLNVSFGYIPEGMKPSGKGEHYYICEEGDFGYYTDLLAADTEGGWTESFVTNAEELSLNGHEALLVETEESLHEDWKQMYLYISCPEYDQIVSIWGWGHCSRDDIVKIGEGLTLTDTGETIPIEEAATWSNYVAYKSGAFNDDLKNLTEYEARTEVSDAEMGSLHRVGDSFTADVARLENGMIAVDKNPVEVSVTDVKTAEDLSLLKADRIPEQWLELETDGGLKTDLVFMKTGDGEESLNEVIEKETRDLTLVYVTVQYTNTGNGDLEDVFYMGSLLALDHEDGVWRIAPYVPEGSEAGENIHAYYENALVGPNEMFYYDVTGGEGSNNYIPSLKAGKTQEVHMAWVVDSKMLDKLYLNLSGSAGSMEFTDEALASGYVALGLK